MEKREFMEVMLPKVTEISKNAGFEMSPDQQNGAVGILNSVKAKVSENSQISSLNQILWTNKSFIQQVYNFSILGLSLNENDFYVDLRRHGRMENGVQKFDIGLWLQYQGKEKLMMRYCHRGGGIKRIVKDVVCNGESVKVENDMLTGQTRIKEHQYNPFDRKRDKDSIVGAYAIAYFNDGSVETAIVDKIRIDRAISASSAGMKGPWSTDYAAMCEKTASNELFKKMKKYLDLTHAKENALESAETIEDRKEETPSQEFNIPETDDDQIINAETGEVIETTDPKWTEEV